MLMAAARLDLASVFLYAGSIMPGWVKLEDGSEKEVTLIDAFEAVGACAAGKMSMEDLTRIEKAICPGEGACGGMYTANTMACIGEALGMSLPGSAAPPSADRRRDDFARKSGEAVVNLLRKGITARDIMTKKAFENAIAVTMAFGGSTNAVLHLLAIAREAEVELTLDDFNRIGDRIPHLGDLKPFGRYVMTDVDKIGGVPVIMRALLDAGLLHGDCLTVTGKTIAENLAAINPPDLDGKILRALDNPIHKTGGITILHGSMAPEGAVVKSAGFDADVFEGSARRKPSTAAPSRSSRTVTGSAWTSRPAPSTSWSTTPSSRPARSAGSRSRPSSPRASWPSTPSSSTAPPPARTAGDSFPGDAARAPHPRGPSASPLLSPA